MLVSHKWLRSYVRCDASPEEIAHRLTMAGLEVEAATARDLDLKGVVVGRIQSIRKHPGDDRLQICDVLGPARRYQVVCGAPNLTVGQLIPLALDGVRLANGIEIHATEIRGVHSEGLLCSERELGLGEDASGIMVLPDSLTPGTPLVEALDLEDYILDIGITPNRGDCLSVLGIAREVAALFRAPLSPPDINLAESGPSIESLASLTIEDADLCPRYAGRLVQNLIVRPSPLWMRQRLAAHGIRAINNIVDVTNYVMLEYGQPLHAFDYHLLDGHRIVVRRARPQESFVTLDGQSRTLLEDMLLICDASRGVALAGIMGGLNSEITEQTTAVFIESACFDPTSIRRTAKALGLSTESSYRFERGVDPEAVTTALDRAAQLMVELGDGELAAGRLDAYPAPISRQPIELRVSRTREFLGLELSREEIRGHLESLFLEVRDLSENVLEVTPPSFRADLTREVDLAEEVARLAGYDRIPSTLPRALVTANKPPRIQTLRQHAKRMLAGLGFSEIISYSFVSPRFAELLGFSGDDRRRRQLAIRNPLSEEQAVMRTTLVPGILETAARNQRQNNFDLSLFELSKVFFPEPDRELPEERLNLCGLLCGHRRPQAWNQPPAAVDFFDVKGRLEVLLSALGVSPPRWSAENPAPYLLPGAGARIEVDGSCLGDLGEVRPEVLQSFRVKGPVFLFDVDFDLLVDLAKEKKTFRPLPRFPAVNRDLALIVPVSVPAQEVLDFLQENRPEKAQSVFLFDHYLGEQVGEGLKSLGLRITYRSEERSLTDQEVNELHEVITRRVLNAFPARLRS